MELFPGFVNSDDYFLPFPSNDERAMGTTLHNFSPWTVQLDSSQSIVDSIHWSRNDEHWTLISHFLYTSSFWIVYDYCCDHVNNKCLPKKHLMCITTHSDVSFSNFAISMYKEISGLHSIHFNKSAPITSHGLIDNSVLVLFGQVHYWFKTYNFLRFFYLCRNFQPSKSVFGKRRRLLTWCSDAECCLFETSLMRHASRLILLPCTYFNSHQPPNSLLIF